MNIPKGIVADIEVQGIANAVSRYFGLEETMPVFGFKHLDPFVPAKVNGVKGPMECVFAFSIDSFPGHRFVVVGWHHEEGGYDTAVVTEEGFQIWPPNVADSFNSPTRESAHKDVIPGILLPMMGRFGKVAIGAFETWVEDCRARRKAIEEDSRG